MLSRIYLDHNSTTPLDPEVADVMMRVAHLAPGNPASAHATGASVRQHLEDARATVAHHLGASIDEVIFTSGATEANNLALFGLSQAADDVYYSAMEHPSVVEPCLMLGQAGAKLHSLAVNHQGEVELTSLPADTAGLIAVQMANHETGTVQHLDTLRQHAPRARIHTDATQAVGKIPVHFHSLGVSTLSCSAHKFFGPVGIGVLLISRCVKVKPRSWGGHQQAGRRPGTEPVMLAVGLAHALERAVKQMSERRAICTSLRQAFLVRLQELVPGFIINGNSEAGLVHTLNLSFPGAASELLFIRLDLAGVDCSTGSACSSGSMLASPVLQAMGVPPEVVRSAMRFSFSHLLSVEQVVDAAERVAANVKALRLHRAS